MESSRTTAAPAHSDDAHHVLADSSLTDERIRVLKHGDTFVLFDQYGDIRPSPNGEGGLYHDGTRFLSQFFLELEGSRPFLLSSTVRDDNDQLYVALTNPDLCRGGRVVLSYGNAASGVAKVSLDGHAVSGTAHREPWDAAGRSRHRAALRRRLRRHLRGARPQKEGSRPGSGDRSHRPRGNSRLSRSRWRCQEHAAAIHPAAAIAVWRSRHLRNRIVAQTGSSALCHRRMPARTRPPADPGLRSRAGRCPGATGFSSSAVLRDRDREWAVRRAGQARHIRSAHDDYRAAHRSVPLCRRAVVQYAVWPRRHHHRAGVPLAESESGPGRLALPGIDTGRRA